MEVHENSNFTRRKAIALFGWLSLLPLAGIWYSMVNRKQVREDQEISKLLLKDIPEGFSYHHDYLIRRKSGAIEVYSTKCTHLGCQLKLAENDRLICPCHGSEFNPEKGNALKGPAEKPLEKLNFIAETDYLTIFL